MQVNCMVKRHVVMYYNKVDVGFSLTKLVIS